ncbi:MAG: hypothetical protein OHK0052_27410 [Anaerolineales bacterium]
MTQERIAAPMPGVVARILPNEAVLVLPLQGKVEVLNAVGARIWQLLDGKRSLREVAAIVSNEYDVSAAQAEQDTEEFLRRLFDLKAIQWK